MFHRVGWTIFTGNPHQFDGKNPWVSGEDFPNKTNPLNFPARNLKGRLAGVESTRSSAQADLPGGAEHSWAYFETSP